MKKLSTKTIIAIVLLALISLSSFAMLSFSLADENNGATEDVTKVFAETNVGYTQIDRIIENSHSGDYGDNVKDSGKKDEDGNIIYEIDKEKNKIYNVLEISSSGESSLSALCSNGCLENLVLNGHKSIDTDMNADKINYMPYSCKKDDATLIAAIKKADLIYLHNDPANTFSFDNDISEEVKLALSTAATADYKPFIIDSYNGTIDNMDPVRSYNSLVSGVFNTSLATYKWPMTSGSYSSVADFMGMKIVSAYYSSINGKDAKDTWVDVPKADGSTTHKMAKVLTIGTDTDMTGKLKAATGGVLVNSADYDITSISDWDDANTYVFDSASDLYKYGYSKIQIHPELVKFEQIAAGDISTVDLNNYDFIVLGSDLNAKTLTEDDYRALSTAAYSKIHFLFSPALSTGSSAGGSAKNPAPSYAYVLDKVATSTDVPKFGNVLVTNFVKMSSYANAKKAKGVDDIANIIINGSFRGINMNSGDDTSNIYTVLEIEPSYPVDTELAKAFYQKQTYNKVDKKYNYQNLTRTFFSEKFDKNVLFDKYKQNDFYYLRTNSVLDATADEISYDGDTPLSNVQDIAAAVETAQNTDTSLLQDYYRWTLSKAKIAHAVGLGYNQVKVVHMSSAEFNTSRVAIADAYDAIYIGGDTSGIKETDKWENGGQYRMYFANGDTNKEIAGSTGTYRSNDISNKKRDELIEYAKHLPVIIDVDVKNAMNPNTGSIDPSSNMYKVIDAVDDGIYTLYGFDPSQTVKISNPDNMYGVTYGGLVTVFNGSKVKDNEEYIGDSANYQESNHSTDEDVFSAALAKSQRPKLSLTKMPKLYAETDSTTWITKNDFQWDYKVTGSNNVTVKVFIDDNANGQFEDPDEERGNKTGASGTLDPTKNDDGTPNKNWIGDDFFGPVYWKFVAIDNNTGASVSTTGISKIKRVKQDKMKVTLLQICPDVNANWADNGDNTLFLCTECQMTRTIATGNISNGDNQGIFGQQATELHGDGLKSRDPKYVNGTTLNILNTGNGSIVSRIESYDSSYKYSDHGNKLGIHDHKFGIVKYDDHETRINKYVGYDNWRTNWFLDFENDYEVDATLMSIDEYQNYCENVENVYSGMDRDEIESTKETYSQAASDYEKYYKCMVEVLNGNYNDAKNPNITSDDKKDFEKFLKEKMLLGANVSGGSVSYVNSPTAEQVTAMLNAFSKSAENCDTYLSANKSTIASNNKMNCTEAEASSEIDYLCDSSIKGDNKSYYLYFSLFTDTSETLSQDFARYYVIWRDAKILEQYLHYEYRENAIYASVYYEEDCDKSLIGKIDLTKCFSCIAVGAAENFGKRDINELGCNSLLNYINKDGAVFLFHDALVPENVINGAGTPTMTRILGDAFGQGKIADTASAPISKTYIENNNGLWGWQEVYASSDAPTTRSVNPGTYTLTTHSWENPPDVKVTTSVDTYTIGKANNYSVSVVVGSDRSIKFELATEASSGYSLTQRSLQYKSQGSEHNKYYISQQKHSYFDYETETNNQTLHGSHDLRDTIYNKGYRTSSDKANQVNEGVITEYPFTIDSTLTISPTASSGFTANVDESEMVVYYTISGGSLGTASSMYTANPNDGANHYFLYQYNNVTYTGAGHSLITGVGRNNNDERRLFINVILNTARMSTSGPQLTCHDIDSTDTELKNADIKETSDANVDMNSSADTVDTEEYVTYIESVDELPEFTFRPVASQGIKSIEIWYDVLNKGTDQKNVYNGTDVDSDGNKDVLIYQISTDNKDDLVANTVISERVKKIHNDTGPKTLEVLSTDTSGNVTYALKLQNNYFTGRNNTCTYICVKLTDKKNRTVTKTIRVEYKPELLDLN